MNAVIYSRLNCPYVGSIKSLLSHNGISFYESIIGIDVVQEAVEDLFPGFAATTLVAIDGQWIGGYNELKEYFRNRPQLLID